MVLIPYIKIRDVQNYESFVLLTNYLKPLVVDTEPKVHILKRLSCSLQFGHPYE